MSKLVQLENIWLKYWKKVVLDNLSFDINKKEIVSIIWLNWSWKSSLLKLLAGIKKPTSWKKILHTKAVSYVPQKLNFDRKFPLTVKEFMIWYLQKDLNLFTKVKNLFNWNEKQLIEKIKTSLQEIDGVKLLDSNIWDLSWWEKQRVLIALALAQDPELLLMDEPTAWVDIKWEDQFYALVDKIYASRDVTIVLVSHDMHAVFSKSTKILCINKSVCCHWKPDELQKSKWFKDAFGRFVIPYSHNHHHIQKDHDMDCNHDHHKNCNH